MLIGSKIITYSPAFTLVPTYECFNRCAYCNFRVEPGQDTWLTLAQAEAALKPLQSQGIIEILILSGEVHPQHPQRSPWFERIYDLCELALTMGFLPHTNAGPLRYAEMARLKTVNVSMGLMLEQLTPTLQQTVHRHAPSKVPALRLQQLEWAGELGIPFTTGLLLGLGETTQDRIDTLEAIAQTHQRYGHIQEVILQPHSPGQQQQWQGAAFSPQELVEVVAIARQVLVPSIALQIPPNLLSSSHLLECLAAGATDLGGIGPKDEVNPDYPHPHDAGLANVLQQAGWHLAPRLPVYPQYETWLSSSLQGAVRRWRDQLKQWHPQVQYPEAVRSSSAL
ncbi:7,8-didemethyl-8-hydroxy-5-deazariboflavin synthase subunit CofG [Oculatella sp. LEGE 06141]|uniref:7,8-didemethyl-8-hydroxy-5-deazariboflavin synthase subunit CofG n=1 Tax=Oculatella sp. LEGE 06141 TaxID=1828648 RepID=UPI00187E236F|nr:7,8-didemethyl-8-hydroxy-5-deazariboflavin synthase subunit CofG [Oculatella sp. LEGE 06141]MBE9178489.1 7,8-didemethyl-8-hydroxy-5-deazariboflavin synthase subunit CofG [Oculatella sp. LEGE 06141]